MRLANITWPQAEAYFKEHDMVLMGVGSIECHGKHMPLGTDTLIPDHLLEDIEKRTDVLICPTLPYGATDTLADFPGTINLGTDVLYDVMRSITDSLWQHGARKFVILNGHGGKTRTLHASAWSSRSGAGSWRCSTGGSWPGTWTRPGRGATAAARRRRPSWASTRASSTGRTWRSPWC